MASCSAASVLGRIGIHLSAWMAHGVVHIRADIDLLDADLGPEEEQPAGELSAEAPGGGLGVAAPHHHHVAVLDDVVHDVVGRVHHADQPFAPDVPGAPVPAFPAVRVAHLLGETAHLVEEQGGAAVRGMDELAFPVAVALYQDGEGAVLLVDAPDLAGDEVGGFVPGDAHVLALAPVLRIASPGAGGIGSALRVPVHALERVLHPVGRVGTLLVRQAPRRRRRLEERLQGLAVLLDLPGFELGGVVLGVPVQRPDADDAAVLDVHRTGHCTVDTPAQTERLEDRLLRPPGSGLLVGHVPPFSAWSAGWLHHSPSCCHSPPRCHRKQPEKAGRAPASTRARPA